MQFEKQLMIQGWRIRWEEIEPIKQVGGSKSTTKSRGSKLGSSVRLGRPIVLLIIKLIVMDYSYNTNCT